MDLNSENNVGFRFNNIEDWKPSWLTKEEVDNILEEMSNLLSEDDMVGVRNIICNMKTVKYVVNKYTVNMNDPDIVYIGRGSKWGNKSPMGSTRSREQVIQDYRLQLANQLKSGDITIDQILSLSGKRLACFCKPQDCHGDIIVNAFNWILNKSIKHP